MLGLCLQGIFFVSFTPETTRRFPMKKPRYPGLRLSFSKNFNFYQRQ
jgi:hypothetical protein